MRHRHHRVPNSSLLRPLQHRPQRDHHTLPTLESVPLDVRHTLSSPAVEPFRATEEVELRELLIGRDGTQVRAFEERSEESTFVLRR